jgi:hypothetical protein
LLFCHANNHRLVGDPQVVAFAYWPGIPMGVLSYAIGTAVVTEDEDWDFYAVMNDSSYAVMNDR